MATARSRWLSAAEVLAGAAIVIGHNVFHRIPNEVPILLVLGLASIALRGGGWRPSGFRRPASWTRTLLWAVLAAVLLQAGSELVVGPLAQKVWAQPVQVSSVFTDLRHDVKAALLGLVLVWTFAALGEELAYRGYLQNRAAEALGGSRLAVAGALVLASVYLASGRNLWAPILAHGLSDTFAVVVVFLGWAN